MKLLSLEQKSPDWLSWRQTGIGSSDVPVLMTGSHFGRTPLSLWQEKVGLVRRERTTSWAMQRGIDNEPVARSWFEAVIDHPVKPVCCTHEEHSWMKASLDGLLIRHPQGASLLQQEAWPDLHDWLQENQGHHWVCEIKVPNQDDHQEALEGRVPEKYRGQLQHQCLVAGTRRCYYISYSLNDRRFAPEEQRTFCTYFPSQAELDQLLEVERTFWQHVLDGVPPSTP